MVKRNLDDIILQAATHLETDHLPYYLSWRPEAAFFLLRGTIFLALARGYVGLLEGGVAISGIFNFPAITVMKKTQKASCSLFLKDDLQRALLKEWIEFVFYLLMLADLALFGVQNKLSECSAYTVWYAYALCGYSIQVLFD